MSEFDVSESVTSLIILWACAWVATASADGKLIRSGLGPPSLEKLGHVAVAFRHGSSRPRQINGKKVEDTEQNPALLAVIATGGAGGSEGFKDSVGMHVRYQKEIDT